MTSFTEAVEMVKAIESSGYRAEGFLVNPNDIQSGIELKFVPYGDVLKSLGFVKQERIEEIKEQRKEVAEKPRQPQQPTAKPQASQPMPQPQVRPQPQPQPQPQVQMQPNPQLRPQPQPQLQSQPQAQPQQQPEHAAEMPKQMKPVKPRRHVFEKELNNAASRLEKIASVSKSVEKKIQERQEQKRLKGLILPTLSLSDQISDLEKINEGLKEGVFNAEQLKIIKLETSGLARLIAEGKQPNVPTDLAELRNKLLKQVIDVVDSNVV